MNRHIHIKLGDLDIPIEIIEEKRRNARAGFGKDAILLRIPRRSCKQSKLKHIKWVKSWLVKTHERRPKVFERYRPVTYYNNKLIDTAYNKYTIKTSSTGNKSVQVKLTGHKLHIKIPFHLSENEKEIGKEVSRCIANDQFHWIEKRVRNLNAQHFQENIHKISLRYAETRWGSCNSNGNISISTRALLAPIEIIDHIIIHELAHLKELNHSPAFWWWVAKADPNHIDNDKWLHKYGYALRF